MHVVLLVTGKAELRALPEALGRLFTGHTFNAVPWTLEAKGPVPFPSFTSGRLPSPPDDAYRPLDELIASAAAFSLESDGVVILDDIELANAGQPQVVVRTVREAVVRHLGGLGGGVAKRTRARLLERVSVHFAVPMLESWFFADPNGLARANVDPRRLPPLVASAPNYEGFRAGDETFLADDGSNCTAWTKLVREGGANKKNTPGWLLRGPDRARHPKDYLSWLRRAPGAPRCTDYQETADGAAALQGLDWPAALRTGNELPFLRSLVEDLVDLLGPPSSPVPAGPTSPHTSRHHLPHDPLLRNM